MSKNKKDSFIEEFDFKLFLNIVKKNIKYILIFFVLVFISTFIYLRYTQPVYEAKCLVQINNDNKADKLFEKKSFYDDDLYRKIEVMQSPVFIHRVLSKLPVDVSVFIKGKVLNYEMYKTYPFEIQYELLDSSINTISIELKVKNDHFVINKVQGEEVNILFKFHEPVSLPLVRFIFSPKSESISSFFNSHENEEYILQFNNIDQLSLVYSKKINITVVNDIAKTISISLKDNNPQKATDIVNQVSKEFSDFEIEYQKNSSINILEFIERQLSEVEKNLNEARDSMNLNKASQIDTSINKGVLHTRIYEIDNLISKNEIEIESLEQFDNSFTSNKNDIISLLAIINGTESQTFLSPYLQSLKDLEIRKQDLLMRVTENSTAIESIKSQIDFQRKIIKESTLGLINKYKKSNSRLLAEKNSIIQKLSIPTPLESSQQSNRERFYSVNEKFYNQLIEKRIEYSIAQAGFVSQLIVLQPAQVNNKPVAPNKTIIWLGVLIFFLLTSIAFLIIRYILYDEIVSLRDVKKLTKIPILGVVPKYKSHIPASQLIVDTRPRSLLAESLRAIRTNLQFIKNVPHSKVVSISSTVSGEGKTFVAINLAGVLAFNNKKVIVLDFDLRKPKIHIGFNTDNDKGISTILLSIDDPDSCIRQSNIPNLHFITAGPVPINPSELILSENTDKLLDYLKTKYDYIILDTPPIGLVSDAMKPLQNADFPIYVVRANYSKRSYIYNVDKLYNENNLRYLSIILNNVDPSITGAGKSKGYTYGYGYGYDNSKHGYYDSEDVVKTSKIKKFFNEIFKKS
ncbi:MAG: polysaccharide biosynthesis tyrosine autokinase [Bacteroidales bacterium]|nr:polysaccharide biosynthesis tyrosine autokinase [Bacteroidales bacterium]